MPHDRTGGDAHSPPFLIFYGGNTHETRFFGVL